MAEAQKFQALKPGDFIVIMVRRKKQYTNPKREETLEYYGLGKVVDVDLRGACTTYTDWKDQAHKVADVEPAQTWAIGALTVAADALWGAWKARSGQPFMALEGITGFVRDFRLRTLANQPAKTKR